MVDSDPGQQRRSLSDAAAGARRDRGDLQSKWAGGQLGGLETTCLKFSSND